MNQFPSSKAPLVTELPKWPDAPDLPPGFEARLANDLMTNGSAYVVIWHPVSRYQAIVPLKDARPDIVFLMVEEIYRVIQPFPRTEGTH